MTQQWLGSHQQDVKGYHITICVSFQKALAYKKFRHLPPPLIPEQIENSSPPTISPCPAQSTNFCKRYSVFCQMRCVILRQFCCNVQTRLICLLVCGFTVCKSCRGIRFNFCDGISSPFVIEAYPKVHLAPQDLCALPANFLRKHQGCSTRKKCYPASSIFRSRAAIA